MQDHTTVCSLRRFHAPRAHRWRRGCGSSARCAAGPGWPSPAGRWGPARSPSLPPTRAQSANWLLSKSLRTPSNPVASESSLPLPECWRGHRVMAWTPASTRLSRLSATQARSPGQCQSATALSCPACPYAARRNAYAHAPGADNFVSHISNKKFASHISNMKRIFP